MLMVGRSQRPLLAVISPTVIKRPFGTSDQTWSPTHTLLLELFPKPRSGFLRGSFKNASVKMYVHISNSSGKSGETILSHFLFVPPPRPSSFSYPLPDIFLLSWAKKDRPAWQVSLSLFNVG